MISLFYFHLSLLLMVGIVSEAAQREKEETLLVAVSSSAVTAVDLGCRVVGLMGVREVFGKKRKCQQTV